MDAQDSDAEGEDSAQTSQESSPQHKGNENTQQTEDSCPDSKRVLDENANKTPAKSDEQNSPIKTETKANSTDAPKKSKSKSSSSSESSRESDDTVISVDGSDRDSKSQVGNQGQTRVTFEVDDEDIEKKQRERSAPSKSDLHLQLTAAQNLQSKLSPICEGRESQTTSPSSIEDKPSMSPRNKEQLQIQVPPRSSVTQPDRSSPALPKTPSNTPDLPRKQMVTINEPKTKEPRSPGSSSYGELSPPFSPTEESSKTNVPKPRKANLKGKKLKISNTT